MTFKARSDILIPDRRFQTTSGAAGEPIKLEEYRDWIDDVVILGDVPAPVQASIDRAKNLLLYAFFAYDLLIVGTIQALTTFELALKLRIEFEGLKPNKSLGPLIEQARKAGILPPRLPTQAGVLDPFDTLRHLRNDLAHGTSDIHSPVMALEFAAMAGRAISEVFPPNWDASH